jgi:hypothetical protein
LWWSVVQKSLQKFASSILLRSGVRVPCNIDPLVLIWFAMKSEHDLCNIHDVNRINSLKISLDFVRSPSLPLVTGPEVILEKVFPTRFRESLPGFPHSLRQTAIWRNIWTLRNWSVAKTSIWSHENNYYRKIGTYHDDLRSILADGYSSHLKEILIANFLIFIQHMLPAFTSL